MESEPSSEAESPPAPPPPVAPKPRRTGGALEWFWGAKELAALRAAQLLPSARTLELARRAHAAIELGRHALEPPQPFEHGPADAMACDLLAQAVYWALLARKSLGQEEPPPETAEPDAVATPREDLAALLAQADSDVLARAAGGRDLADALGRAVAGKSFLDYAAMPREQQAELARNLMPFAEELCAEVDTVRLQAGRIRTRRVLGLGALVLLLGVSVWGVATAVERIEVARDIAQGKPWVASSKYPEYGCVSPAQECANSNLYFFCTNAEEGPWIEFDLGKVESVSGARIDNRGDCCAERAVPLAIEVSVDHVKYREVARRKEDFSSWKAKFPTAQARWVRLKVPRHTFLHLSSVRLFH